MTAREHDATVAAALAHLASQSMTALPVALVAAVPFQERTKEKRQSIARRAYEELHTLAAEAFCWLGERSMARHIP